MTFYHVGPIIGDSLRLHKKVQMLEKTLSSSNKISFKKRDDLFYMLEQAQKSMELLEKKALLVDRFARKQIEGDLTQLKEKIISLYGRIDTLSIDYEVSQVVEEAGQLESDLKSAKNKQISKAVNNLKKHIATLCHDHALSQKNRHAIAIARSSLKKVDAVLKGKAAPSCASSKVIPLLQTDVNFFEEEFDEEAIELFEIAYLFYYRNMKEAMLRLNKLSESAKDKFRKHMKVLKGADPQFDIFKTIKALIAVAHDISLSSDGSSYLTRKEIRNLFKEVDEIQAQERKKTVHLSFSSKKSLGA